MTAVASDLILIEDDMCQFSVGRAPSVVINLTMVLGTFHSTVLEILIPRSGKDFIDGPLSVLLLD